MLAEYGEVQDRWTALRGWEAPARLAEIRQRLDITHLPDDAPLHQVSGGEQARLTLASVLLAEPDVLVLDEPTNHLDAEGAAWLGAWLARYPGGVLVVSHDRAFLDRVVARIIELDGIHEEPRYYEGGYTAVPGGEAGPLGALPARLRGAGEAPPPLGGGHRGHQGARAGCGDDRAARARAPTRPGGTRRRWRRRRRRGSGGCAGRWTRPGGSPSRPPGRSCRWPSRSHGPRLDRAAGPRHPVQGPRPGTVRRCGLSR